jgi:hypothetical protein
MRDLIKVIDHIRHEEFRPLYQSLQAHIQIAHNSSLHISPAVLKDIVKRLKDIENQLLSVLE